MPKKIVCQSELFIGFHPRIFILRLFLTKKKKKFIFPGKGRIPVQAKIPQALPEWWQTQGLC